MDKIINNLNNIIYLVDDQYQITYASPKVSSITGCGADKSLGKKCFEEFVKRVKPCIGCPIATESDQDATLEHDIINLDGERSIYLANVHKTDDGYLETLTDITQIKLDIAQIRHEAKRLKSDQVETKLKNQDKQKQYDFLDSVINHISYGVMVVDAEYNIHILNNAIKSQTSTIDLSKQKCHEVYGLSEPCHDCPLADKALKKASRVINGRDFTVLFETHKNFIIENIRDTTREIKLIKQIQESQKEVQEKQRQMSLLNNDLLRMNDQLKVAKKVIDEELKQVGQLQQSLLPESLPVVSGYDFGAFYIPAEHAGGDYYDCIQMSNDFWGFTVADVSGHGTPAAVIMAMARAIMRSYTYDVISSSEALYMVNEILCDNVHTTDFVTMFYMVLDAKKGKFNFASAGHNPVLIFDKSEMMVRRISANGMFLAAFPGVSFEEKEWSLDSGDVVFMYTDGLVEAMNPARQQYGLDSVISRLIMYADTHPDNIIEEIMADVKAFTQNTPFDDDVTILVVKKS